MKAESPGALVRSILSSQLEAQGFFAQGFLSARSFLSVLDETGVSAQIRERYGTDQTPSLAAVALNYSDGPEAGPAWAQEAAGAFPALAEPCLAIARFARANWYAEINRRLTSAVMATRIAASVYGLKLPGAKAWKRLVNSSLPEKALALRAGLGWIGKNTILIASGSKGRSSAVLLGLLLCPIDLEPADSSVMNPTDWIMDEARADNPGREEVRQKPGTESERCGSCRRCVQACPTGALGIQGSSFNRQRCIQHWTHIDQEPPADILPFLSGRLYGCDICLEACPYFSLDREASCSAGALGPAIPARTLLALSESDLKEALRGTVLDRSWISLKALRRNAALSLGALDGEGSCRTGEAEENQQNDH